MKWRELKKAVKVIKEGNDKNPFVTDIIHDSRLVKSGSVFVAIPGFKDHGDLFISDAVNMGAAAVVSENPQPDCKVPWIQVYDSRQSLGILAKKVWNISFNDIITVGITGTNGKTTTAELYHNLYKNIYGNKSSMMFSTIEYKLGERTETAIHTTPEASDLFRFIGTSPQKPKSLVMEVSSHALSLHRIECVLFDIAVWTNLTQDHLDFHGDMESYYNAKKTLFLRHIKKSGTAVINIDDLWGRRLSEELSNIDKVTYGFSDNADMKITNSHCTWASTEVDVTFRNESMHFKSCLTGFFNVYNMTALAAGCAAQGITKQKIQESFELMKAIPGRMESVDISADFKIIVDYAHTPEALKNVLSTAINLCSGKVICLFGCGGDRDSSKRPLMAEAVANNCDEAVITTDNPRTESPKKIIDDILEGIPLDFSHWVIPDRKEAIKKAIQLAQCGDCVIIAGKGHETYQEINGVRHHFDDREVVMELASQMELV